MTCRSVKARRMGGNWSGPMNAAFGNWQVTLIERATTGFPVFVINSDNESEVNFEYNFLPVNRPDQICDPSSGGHSISQWFNTSCLVPGWHRLRNCRRTWKRLSCTDFRTEFREHGSLVDQALRGHRARWTGLPGGVLQSLQPCAIWIARRGLGGGCRTAAKFRSSVSSTRLWAIRA